MINRDLIRIKIVQLTYAYYQNGNKNMDSAEKELLFSLSKAYDLYHYLLSLIVAITEQARKHVDVATARAQREGGEMPSQKFALNRFALQLEENEMLRDFIETKGLRWNEQEKLVLNLYQQISESEVYVDYMTSPEDSYEADRELWRKLYKQFIMRNDALSDALEEMSLYWNDDKEIIDTFVVKTIKRFDPAQQAHQELLPEYRDIEDREFARKLFRTTIMNADQYQRYMSDASRNWDFSRLAYMDIVLMQIAIAEMVNFPGIPISVTINEYVELAKIYSTPRSGGYINGMLDAIARYLNRSGVIFKPMSDPRAAKQKAEEQAQSEPESDSEASADTNAGAPAGEENEA